MREVAASAIRDVISVASSKSRVAQRMDLARSLASLSNSAMVAITEGYHQAGI